MPRDKRDDHSADALRRFGGRLRAMRRATGLNQSDFSEHIDVSLATYTGWERGAWAPGLESLARLARVPGVRIDELLGALNDDSTVVPTWGVTWGLRRNRYDPASEVAAAVWSRLLAGESRAVIARALGRDEHDVDAVERPVQDLLIAEELAIDSVPRAEALERELAGRYSGGSMPRVRDAWVGQVGHVEWLTARYVLLGHLAKEMFQSRVEPGDRVGLCGGFAVSRMVYALERGKCPVRLRVSPVATTPAFEQPGVSANSLAGLLAYRHFDSGVEASELPFTSDDAGIAGDDVAKRILDDAAHVDWLFMGIGGRDSGTLTLRPTDRQRDYQWLAGVDLGRVRSRPELVGDVLYHLIDADGRPLAEFEEASRHLVCSIGLDGLRQLVERGKRVVIIAAGESKADVVRAALRAGYANTLIVDDELATAIL